MSNAPVPSASCCTSCHGHAATVFLPTPTQRPFTNAEYEALASFTDTQYVTIVAALNTDLGRIIKRLVEINVRVTAERDAALAATVSAPSAATTLNS